mgnify:CR=1 FL=1
MKRTERHHLKENELAQTLTAASDALAVKVFEQRDCIFARQAAGDLFEHGHIHFGVDRFLRPHTGFQLFYRGGVKNQIADAEQPMFGGKQVVELARQLDRNIFAGGNLFERTRLQACRPESGFESLFGLRFFVRERGAMGS